MQEGDTVVIRIFVDFNALSEDGKRVWINTRVDKHLRDTLQPGLPVVLYSSDMEVEAIIELDIDDRGEEWWYGLADWSTACDLD